MAVRVEPRDDRPPFDPQQMFAGQHDLPVRIDDFQPFDHQTVAYLPGESRLSWTVSRMYIVSPIYTGRMNRLACHAALLPSLLEGKDQGRGGH